MYILQVTGYASMDKWPDISLASFLAHRKLRLGQTVVSSCLMQGLLLLGLKELSRIRVQKEFSFFIMVR